MQMTARIEEFPVDDWTKAIPGGCLLDRDQFVIEYCRGRSVLHIGACDAPFEYDKGKTGGLLHQKVRAVSSRIVGLDVDGPAIEALRGFGINDIINADITQDEGTLAGEKFDVILCCDVIEHVRSAGPLLQACQRFMAAESNLIVTTINATALKPALRALAGKEAVHNDHVAYYSYATLGKLLVAEGFRPTEYGVFAYPTISPIVGWVSRALMSVAPGSADGILICAQSARN